MTLSPADLIARAGVDPWGMYNQLHSGDPAQVSTLGAAFARAGGDLAEARSSEKAAAGYIREGYTVDGASPLDVDAEVRATATSPEHLAQIGKILDAVAQDLDQATTRAGVEVDRLNGELAGIETAYESFMRGVGHHLPPDDQDAARAEFVTQATNAVRTHGSAVKKLLVSYEETVYGAQRSMADLGYTAPVQLDDLGTAADERVAQLQQLARQEAGTLRSYGRTDSGYLQRLHQVAGDVSPYLDDPYFASAFYGALGTQGTSMLPMMAQASGGDEGAGDDLRTLSHLFGTAVTNADDDPAMGAVAQSFLDPPPDVRLSFSRAVMVSGGDFPPDWLAQAARANALDDFARHGAEGHSGMGFDDQYMGRFGYEVGVSSNTVAAWTQALGRNPQAAREALATMGADSPDVHLTGDPTAAYEKNVHDLVEYGKQEGYPGDVARGYGAAFEAAAGADDETDGAHSAQAASFAKALFTQVDHDGGDVQPGAAGNFAKIGASYVQELAAGGDRPAGDHSLGDVGQYERVPGDDAAFAVAPGMAKTFMKTFAGDAEATKVFDTAAGQAANRAMLASARADAQGVAAGRAPFELTRASEAYGSVAGSENGAALQVVGKQVEDEEHANEIMRNILSAGIDMVPAGKLAEAAGGVVAHVSDSVWDAMKHTSNMALEASYSAPSGSEAQLTELKDANYSLAMVGDYQATAVLQESGYPGVDVPPQLLGPDGHMLPVAQVMSSDSLKGAYYDYMYAQAHSTPSRLGQGVSTYELTKNAASRFEQAYVLARGDDEGRTGG